MSEDKFAQEEDDYCCDAKLPEGISISPSGAMASCYLCGYRSGLWECACELEHDCEEVSA